MSVNVCKKHSKVLWQAKCVSKIIWHSVCRGQEYNLKMNESKKSWTRTGSNFDQIQNPVAETQTGYSKL